MFESLNHVDWDLLDEQKQALVNMRTTVAQHSSEHEALSGIIHLLDALQDDAVSAGRWMFPDDTKTRSGTGR